MNEEQKEYVENLFFKKEGFIKYAHMYPISIKKEEVSVGVTLTENTLNPNSTAHGGLIYSLADTAMGLLIFLKGNTCVTANASINYLKKGNGEKLIATATPIKLGKTLCVLETKIQDEKENLLAIVTGTYYITGNINR